MRSPAIADGECASIRLTFDENERATSGVRIAVRMRDDRRAERVVSDPDELVPTALMLLTTAVDEPAAAPVDEPPLPPPTSSSSSSPSMMPVPKEKLLAPPAPQETITFGLQGGVRGGADSLASPTVHAFASLTLRRWEAGLLGGLDAGYQSLETSPPPGDMAMKGSSVNAGAFIGRREPMGSVFELFFGGRAVLAFVTGYSQVRLRTGAFESMTSDPDSELRTGGYIGTAFPRKLPIRFRTDFSLDMIPSNLGGVRDEGEVSKRLPPITPWWTACLQIGLEIAR
jgi:hypothetical protein